MVIEMVYLSADNHLFTYHSNLIARVEPYDPAIARPVESDSGALENILAGTYWGEIFQNFLFKMVHSGVLYIF